MKQIEMNRAKSIILKTSQENSAEISKSQNSLSNSRLDENLSGAENSPIERKVEENSLKSSGDLKIGKIPGEKKSTLRASVQLSKKKNSGENSSIRGKVEEISSENSQTTIELKKEEQIIVEIQEEISSGNGKSEENSPVDSEDSPKIPSRKNSTIKTPPENSSEENSPENSSQPTPEEESAPPPPPPPPPPPLSPVQAAQGSPSGRNALLSAIQNFDKKKLSISEKIEKNSKENSAGRRNANGSQSKNENVAEALFQGKKIF
jgi:hypothetical protein